MIPAIVLAAGASTRMGRPKALLDAGGKTFIRRILDTLSDAGVSRVAVVIRPADPAVTAEVVASGFAQPVVNPQPDQGQLSSLLAGLTAIDEPGVDAALVTLVDVPLITSATVSTLIVRAALSSASILRAVHDGRHGHPVVFKRRVFDALRSADLSAGAKAVMRAYGVEDVEVPDPGIARDVDTPEDYASLVFPAAARDPRPY